VDSERTYSAAERKVMAGRRHAIYALVAFCAAFFIVSIVASYLVAAHYGFGTGFGDGFVREDPKPEGTGFWGDAAILIGNTVVVALIFGIWCWLLSRLEAISADDPVLPEGTAVVQGVDPTSDESWYYVQIPVLTKALTAVAVICLAGVALFGAALLPLALIRYGW
jgi:hypothetical protein